MPKFLLCQSFFAIVPQMRVMAGSEIIDKLVDFFMDRLGLWSWSRALDEPNDNPEQREARWDFYKRNGFKTGLSWNMKVWVLRFIYRGDHLTKKPTEIFRKLGKSYYWLSIKHRRLVIYNNQTKQVLVWPGFHILFQRLPIVFRIFCHSLCYNGVLMKKVIWYPRQVLWL